MVQPQFSFERMVSIVEAVRDRARRTASALERAGISHAVVGGNAVAAWVMSVDARAGRNTQDVDVLVRRGDVERVIPAMESAGFIHRHAAGVDLFLDGPEGTARTGVHLVYAGEKVRPEYPMPAPDVSESRMGPEYRILNLDALVRMKLTSFRMLDQVHVMDLMDVGLVDESWVERLPVPLGERLRSVMEAREREA